MVTLDLGCGDKKKADIGVDIRKVEGVTDYVLDISQPLPFEDCKFSAIIASDVFEHFPRAKIVSILKEWIRVLEHGGTITIKTPNINTLALAYVHGKIDGWEFARKMYGNGTLIESSLPQDFHYYGYDTITIEQVLKEAGLTEINIRPSGDGGDYPNMIIQARKPSPVK